MFQNVNIDPYAAPPNGDQNDGTGNHSYYNYDPQSYNTRLLGDSSMLSQYQYQEGSMTHPNSMMGVAVGQSGYPIPSNGSGLSSGSIIQTSSTTIDKDEELEAAQLHAIKYLSFRLKVLFVLHLIPVGMLINTYFWFTSVIGLVLVAIMGLYVWTHRQSKAQFVVLYSGLIIINLIKNIIIFMMYFFHPINDLNRYEYSLTFILLVDALLALITLYNSLWLYRSYSMHNLTF